MPVRHRWEEVEGLEVIARARRVSGAGKSDERLRRYAKSVWDLAVHTQHDQMADVMDAALCGDATHSLVRVVLILEQLDLTEPSND